VGLLGFIALNVWFIALTPHVVQTSTRGSASHLHTNDASGFAGDDRLRWSHLATDLVVVWGVAFGLILAFERYLGRQR